MYANRQNRKGVFSWSEAVGREEKHTQNISTPLIIAILQRVDKGDLLLTLVLLLL